MEALYEYRAGSRYKHEHNDSLIPWIVGIAVAHAPSTRYHFAQRRWVSWRGTRVQGTLANKPATNENTQHGTLRSESASRSESALEKTKSKKMESRENSASFFSQSSARQRSATSRCTCEEMSAIRRLNAASFGIIVKLWPPRFQYRNIAHRQPFPTDRPKTPASQTCPCSGPRSSTWAASSRPAQSATTPSARSLRNTRPRDKLFDT
ncbi:hypothetical protein V8C34DRAFT_247456 [Trichoderma compactum]